MQVRGAPLIALVASLGLSVHLAAVQSSFETIENARKFILDSIVMLRDSRPTAVNLFVATDELRYVCMYVFYINLTSVIRCSNLHAEL